MSDQAPADQLVCSDEERRDERRFKHHLGYIFAITTAIAILSIVFIIGWTVIVQEKDLHEGAAGSLFQALVEVMKIIFS